MWSEEADIGMFYDEVKIGDGQQVASGFAVLIFYLKYICMYTEHSRDWTILCHRAIAD